MTTFCIFAQVEFIVMGGTFMSLDTNYKDFFIRNLHDALSGHHSSSVAEVPIYILDMIKHHLCTVYIITQIIYKTCFSVLNIQ